MAQPTPFHPRTAPLCESQAWRQWSGYFAATNYKDFVQPEYAAIRHSAALIDVSPLYKYDVSGPDATALVNRVITQNALKMKGDQVVYTCWCDADGKVRQDGTVFRFSDGGYRFFAAEPAYGWLKLNAVGFDVRIEDVSQQFAGLSLQGPHSRRILAEAVDEDGEAVESLAFFRHLTTKIRGVEVSVSRTGYTGDLGYELFLPADRALDVWDTLTAVGHAYQITPCGIGAMDIARVEAGFVLIGVDFPSSEFSILQEDKMSPYELGLGWTVKLKSGNFVGRRALAEEKKRDRQKRLGRVRGPQKRVVGLQIDWEPLEELYLPTGLMPDLPLLPCREPVPVYAPWDDPLGGGRQIGRVTTRVWSTLLKKYIALATIEGRYAEIGTTVDMEVTVHYQRKKAPAQVVPRPFYRPERLRA